MEKKLKRPVNNITAWLTVMAFFLPSFLIMNVVLAETARADEPTISQHASTVLQPQRNASSTRMLGTDRPVKPVVPVLKNKIASTSTLDAAVVKIDSKLAELKSLYNTNPIDNKALLHTSQDLINLTQAYNKQIKNLIAKNVRAAQLQKKAVTSKAVIKPLTKPATITTTPTVAK